VEAGQVSIEGEDVWAAAQDAEEEAGKQETEAAHPEGGTPVVTCGDGDATRDEVGRAEGDDQEEGDGRTDVVGLGPE